MLLLFLYHGGDLGFSDWLWVLANFLVVLLSFLLGGLAIYVLRKRKNSKDV